MDPPSQEPPLQATAPASIGRKAPLRPASAPRKASGTHPAPRLPPAKTWGDPRPPAPTGNSSNPSTAQAIFSVERRENAPRLARSCKAKATVAQWQLFLTVNQQGTTSKAVGAHASLEFDVRQCTKSPGPSYMAVGHKYVPKTVALVSENMEKPCGPYPGFILNPTHTSNAAPPPLPRSATACRPARPQSASARPPASPSPAHLAGAPSPRQSRTRRRQGQRGPAAGLPTSRRVWKTSMQVVAN